MKNSLKLIENLSIHGIRHVFVGYGSKFTRFFWSVAILASICGLFYNNYLLYLKLSDVPDINVRTKQKFINKIPFPAITLCNPLFAKDQLVQFFNISKELRKNSNANLNLTVMEQNYLASNIHACSPDFGANVEPNIRNRTDNNIVKLMNESFLSTYDALINCGYRGFVTNCTRVFNRVLTDRGFCYTFNLQGFNTIFNEKAISADFYSYKRNKIAQSMFILNKLSSENIDENNEPFRWSLDLGYSMDHDADSVPVKAEKGKLFGFNPFLKESNARHVCTQVGNVFSYYIHLPNEIMMPLHQGHFVEFRKKNDVFLTARSYTADVGMRKFSPTSRGCYFEGEKQLKFFKSYTKAHCDFECMTNYTLKICGCVKFSMPRSSNTPVCTVDKSDCYFNAMNKWPDHERMKDRFEATCGCLKTCNDIKYDVKFEKTSSSENVMLIFEVFNFSKGDGLSRINFMFDDFEILEYEEYAVYKIQNFVADSGGLLGFFLGCSILSIIEIVYFIFGTCLSKIKESFCAIQRGNKNHKIISQKGSKDMENVKFIKTLQKISDETYINPIRLYHK